MPSRTFFFVLVKEHAITVVASFMCVTPSLQLHPLIQGPEEYDTNKCCLQMILIQLSVLLHQVGHA